MTGSVRRRITINSSFPDMGVPAYRARKGRFERESVVAQTRRIMENIKAIIEEAGGTLDAVVHCRAFLSDMKHFPEFESVYRSYFSAPYPARMTVASAGIYDGLDVEMDAIAYLP